MNLAAIVLTLDNDFGKELPEVPELVEITPEVKLDGLDITASGYPHVTLDESGV